MWPLTTTTCNGTLAATSNVVYVQDILYERPTHTRHCIARARCWLACAVCSSFTHSKTLALPGIIQAFIRRRRPTDGTTSTQPESFNDSHSEYGFASYIKIGICWCSTPPPVDGIMVVVVCVLLTILGADNNGRLEEAKRCMWPPKPKHNTHTRVLATHNNATHGHKRKHCHCRCQ